MYTYRLFGKNRVVKGIYNAGAAGGDGAAGGEGGAGGEGKPAPFTPEQQTIVNQLVAKERREQQDKNKKVVADLEAKIKAGGASEERVAELQSTIDNLEKTYLTKEELSKREVDKLSKESTERIKKLEDEAKLWQSNFTRQLTATQITQAAAENDVYSPEQMLTLLGGQSKVLPVVKDGKPTGDFEVKVVFSDNDKDGNPVVLELSPDATLKRMKELPKRFGNLFKGANSGLGGGNDGTGGTGGNKTLAEVAKTGDTAAYREQRKNNFNK